MEHPPKIQVCQGPQNVTLFGNRVTVDAISGDEVTVDQDGPLTQRKVSL